MAIQGIETGICILIAAALIAVTFVIIRRRDAPWAGYQIRVGRTTSGTQPLTQPIGCHTIATVQLLHAGSSADRARREAQARGKE
jgi:hypothetical protein